MKCDKNNKPDTIEMVNGIFQFMRMEEATGHKWINNVTFYHPRPEKTLPISQFVDKKNIYCVRCMVFTLLLLFSRHKTYGEPLDSYCTDGPVTRKSIKLISYGEFEQWKIQICRHISEQIFHSSLRLI